MNNSINNTQINEIQIRAATTIQKYMRAYLVRRDFLPRIFFEKYVQEHRIMELGICNGSFAKGGKTKVYLPSSIPEIVIKCTSNDDLARKRLHQMRETKKTIKSSVLIIPKAMKYKGDLIEERLPINTNDFHNMLLYVSNPKLFNEVVVDMVSLFSQAYLGDLVSIQRHPMNNIVGDLIRYDNLPFFIEEGKVKLGLVDLEHIIFKPQENGLKTLVRIFPYHYDLIKERANKLNMVFDEKALLETQKKGKKFLKKGVIDYSEWIKEKQITNETPICININEDLKKEAMLLIQKELKKLNNGSNLRIEKVFLPNEILEQSKKIGTNLFSLFSSCLNISPEESGEEKRAKEIAPKILEIFIENLNKEIEAQSLKMDTKDLSIGELIKVRSPVLNHDYKFFEKIGDCFKKDKIINIENNFTRERVAEDLTPILLTFLKEKGVIFSYQPKSDFNPLMWIRF